MIPSVRNPRRILCVFPAYSPSFGTFENAYALRGTTRAFMPPQGLLAIAAYLPKSWEVRLIDENIRRADAKDLAWADAVLVSGMHVQRPKILDINERAHALGKATTIGGPSVSGEPDAYGAFDYLRQSASSKRLVSKRSTRSSLESSRICAKRSSETGIATPGLLASPVLLVARAP